MGAQKPRQERRGSVRIAAAAVCLALSFGLLVHSGAWDAMRARMRSSRWEPQKPTGHDHLTARMRAVRAAVTEKFELPAGSGCFREDGGIEGGGEHPLGRACDFMLGPAGERATGSSGRLGRRIAAWARDNADKYGIWYVIYEQRIWSSRWPQRGNKPMEDRGSITQNHFDHVHISVY
ncbi:hypothetical protein [Wenjunlia tyrosinilytica]|uniref:ARB-07466-like C-terminal domain-containing protein n=1 Tax=Wenjunlia tyrosinilytica TaxID=1544741 RepID=A0A918DT46_9ACTN|nr:hypothetical protein [Wenjunlia tyrosinilytica]GGO81733.1 hypothetical protein GCM10012280_06700 [Wenjunlia tyrosinilytica]